MGKWHAEPGRPCFKRKTYIHPTNGRRPARPELFHFFMWRVCGREEIKWKREDGFSFDK